MNCSRATSRIFLDLKVFDIGETVKRTVKVVVDAGVSFLTIHGEYEIIMAAAEARGSSKLKLLSVTVLTSLDVKDIRDLGYECSLQELALHRTKRALEAGCEGVISSPPRKRKQLRTQPMANFWWSRPAFDRWERNSRITSEQEMRARRLRTKQITW